MTPEPAGRLQDDALYARAKRHLAKALQADPSLSSELERLMSLGLSQERPAPKPLAASPEPWPAKPPRPVFRVVVLAGAAILAAALLLPRLSRKPGISVTAGTAAQPAAPSGEGRADIEWVTIPGGSFLMGSESGSSDEKPVHRVMVKSFQMAKTLATFGQYKKCVSAGACSAAHVSDGTCWVYTGTKWEQGSLPGSFQGDDQPVVCVDWEQARAFSEWAGGRLPTEAEWEYAARGGGKDYKYPWGNEDATCARAVINEGGYGCGRNATWPVCSKPAGNTAQGLCDMAGNAWEWTQDWYHDSYNGAPSDGSAWESPAGSFRVFRGGSWSYGAGYARAARRGNVGPGSRNDYVGVRSARSR